MLDAISLYALITLDLAATNILVLLVLFTLFLTSHPRKKYSTHKTTPTPFLSGKSNNSGSYK